MVIIEIVLVLIALFIAVVLAAVIIPAIVEVAFQLVAVACMAIWGGLAGVVALIGWLFRPLIDLVRWVLKEL